MYPHDNGGKLGERDEREAGPEGAASLAKRPPWGGKDEGGYQHQAIVLAGDPEQHSPFHQVPLLLEEDSAVSDNR
jgi:hypothetical protein